jgi:pimeloyl-ACP methyl ester carboxylesterase
MMRGERRNRLVNTQWIVLAFLSVALLTARGSNAAPAAPSLEQISPYLGPQQLLHIDSGRAINLVCLGHGSPTVILTAGLGDWSLTWRYVQRPLAKRTRVCAWDRAGYGFSSPSREPQDIVHTTEDLERTLRLGHIEGPYVLVGHSMGAYETLRFTDLQLQAVAAIVLVDPSIPDQGALMERIAPRFAIRARAFDQQNVKRLQECAAALPGGTLKPGAAQFEQCTAEPAVPAVFPQLKAAIARLNLDPQRLLTEASTVKEFDSEAAHDSREVMNGQRRYGDMPLIVLSSGRDASAMDFLIGGAAPAEVAQFHSQVARFLREAWIPGHDAYAALSTRGRNQLVPDAGHGIQTDKPAAVISAVLEVLDQIRPGALH